MIKSGDSARLRYAEPELGLAEGEVVFITSSPTAGPDGEVGFRTADGRAFLADHDTVEPVDVDPAGGPPAVVAPPSAGRSS